MQYKECFLSFLKNSSSVEKSADKYVQGISKCDEYLKMHIKGFTTCYDVKTTKGIQHLVDILNSDAEFVDKDANKWNKMYSNSILWYQRFLAAKELFGNQEVATERKFSQTESHQVIFYGAPGTGKSNRIDELTNDGNRIRTTFHPDSDYSTFVGAYKPTMEWALRHDMMGHVVKDENTGKTLMERKITYSFVPQAFLKAYVEAWKRKSVGNDEPFYLVIEEINRGNCAQIFGDIFQLLDRDVDGQSKYAICPDDDIKRFLLEAFAKSNNLPEEIKEGDEMRLPSNLYIWATMNTSDQSLFPIDSAFKRRWDWKYVRISEGKTQDGQSLNYRIKFDVPDGSTVDVSWWKFLKAINKRIEDATKSEDKQLGYFFCKPDKQSVEGGEYDIITAETFVGKVVFYLWNDVFKDYGFKSDIFKRENDGLKIWFHDFYPEDAVVDKDTNPEGIDLKLVETFINKVLDIEGTKK